jgi:hypothetical protein
VLRPCEDFLYGLQGHALRAHRAVPPWPVLCRYRDALREFVMWREVGHLELRVSAGLLSDFGAAA